MSSNPTRIISTSPAELQNQRVATRDLDPDPSNGLKNENQQRNQGSVRQEPITVPMQQQNGVDRSLTGQLPQQTQSPGVFERFRQQIIDPTRDFLFSEDDEDQLLNQRITTQPGTAQPTQQFSQQAQFNPVSDAVSVLQDPFASQPRQFQSQQQQEFFINEQGNVQEFQRTLPLTDVPISERESIALGFSGIVGVPGVGRAGQVATQRLSRIPPRVRGLGVRAERFGQQLGQTAARADFPRLPSGNRGQLQLTEPLQQARGGAQRFMEAARAAGQRPQTPGEQRLVQQIRQAPSGLSQRAGGLTEVQRALQAAQDPRTAFRGFQPGAREVTGGGTPPVDPQLLQISRQQDLAMAARQLAQQRQTAALGRQVSGRPDAFGFLEQAGQISLRDFPSPPGTLESPLGMSEFQVQPGGQQFARGVQQGTGGTGFGFNEIVPGGMFDQPPNTEFDVTRDTTTPDFTRPDVRFDPFSQVQNQFDTTRQRFDTRSPVTQSFQPLQNIQRTPRDPIRTPQRPPFTRIPPRFPPPRTTTTRTPTTRVPTRPPRIPGVPPFPPFAGGGGGAPRAGDRRRFPFGQIREFSPAFPGTSFRVLPDGTVVLDVDPGQRQQSNRMQPRDPETGQFISAVS